MESTKQRDILIKLLDKLYGKNLPFGADFFNQSNPDTNGNYQTITYKKGEVVVKTITLTFDAGGNVLTYSEA